MLRERCSITGVRLMWLLATLILCGGCVETGGQGYLTITSWARIPGPEHWPVGVPICPSWPPPSAVKPGEEKKFVEDLVTEYHSRYPEWRFEAAMTVVAPEGGSVIIIPDEASRVTIHTGEQSYIPVKQEVTNQSLLGVLWLSATYAPSEAVWKAQIHLTHLMILGDPSDCTLIRKTMADAGVREGLNASRPCLQRTLEAVRREVRAIPGIQGLDWTLERLSATSGTDAVRLWVRVSSNR